MDSKIKQTDYQQLGGIADIKDFSNSLDDITSQVDNWIYNILSRSSLEQHFEKTVDVLINRNNLYLLPDFYLEEMTLAFGFISIWLLNGIHQAKATPLDNSSKNRTKLIVEQCRKGFKQANNTLSVCLKKLCVFPRSTTIDKQTPSKASLDRLYAMYALLEDFEAVEEMILNNMITESDIINCPNIPPQYHEATLLVLFHKIFKEVEVDDETFFLKHVDKMALTLNNSPSLLSYISMNVIKFENMHEKYA